MRRQSRPIGCNPCSHKVRVKCGHITIIHDGLWIPLICIVVDVEYEFEFDPCAHDQIDLRISDELIQLSGSL